MKSYSSREVIKALKADGWYLHHTTGDHCQFKHPVKNGCVTVKHPTKDFAPGTIRGIERQSGLRFR